MAFNAFNIIFHNITVTSYKKVCYKELSSKQQCQINELFS